MKKQILLILLIICSIGSKILAQTNTEKNVNSGSTLPSDFPVYVHTGNPENDKATYVYAKYVWIGENREIYDNYVNSITDEQKTNGTVNLAELEENEKLILRLEMAKNTTPQKQIISRQDFNAMPLEKQKLYLAEPDKYVIID